MTHSHSELAVHSNTSNMISFVYRLMRQESLRRKQLAIEDDESKEPEFKRSVPLRQTSRGSRYVGAVYPNFRHASYLYSDLFLTLLCVIQNPSIGKSSSEPQSQSGFEC